MSHIKLFEQFLNENKDLDRDLAEIVLKHLLSSNNKKFSETIYLSLGDRDEIKSKYGKRLPNTLAGPTKYMLSSRFLSPLVGKEVMVDGGSELVVGDDTAMDLKPNTTWEEVAKTLKLV